MNKSDTHAFVNQLLIYTLMMICFSGSIGLGTVWMRQQIARTATNIRQYEMQASDAERREEEIKGTIAVESSQDVLERRNVEWGLGLVQPQESQIHRIGPPPPEQRLAAKRNSELFAVQTVPASMRLAAGDGR